MTASQKTLDTPYLFRMWELGQQYLVEGRYQAACSALEAAEAAAWQKRDAQSLARIYLPLLEARRQIRYQAAEGLLIITSPGGTASEQRATTRAILQSEAGTLLISLAPARRRNAASLTSALRLAASMQFTAARTGRRLETLLLFHQTHGTRLAAPADPRFAAGLEVRSAASETDLIGPSTEPNLVVPLPKPGRYEPRGATEKYHALIRESLLIAWEALALRWQHRHPLRTNGRGIDAAWHELAWLRRALLIDPACEPISMRLIALAEAIQRA